jgi:SAM-dependent methyltransferase
MLFRKKTNQLVPSILPDSQVRRLDRESLNRLPDTSDWVVGSELVETMTRMGEGAYVHRKAWEYGVCVQGLTQLGALTPDARGLAVAAGSERPVFYLTNFVSEIVATDLYDNPFHEGNPEMLTNPAKFAPCDWEPSKLKVLQMDACELRFDDEEFDFCFSLSSIEHFGPREKTIKAISEMRRVLKPGGIACIITELILNKTTHAEYFSPAEFENIILKAPGFELIGGEPDLTISESLVKHPININVDNLQVSPHIVLTDGRVVWTSLSVFLRKI